MRFISAAVITIMIVFSVSMVVTWAALGSHPLVPLIVSIVPCFIGIVVGGLVFYIVSGPLGRGCLVRLASGAISAVIALALDWRVFGHVTAKSASDGFAAATLVAVVYTCVIAAVVSAIFGLGFGQLQPQTNAADEEPDK